jgi:hypothetical protein
MTPTQVAIVISIIALLVSMGNLGWSIYKELGLRGRVRVSIAVAEQFIQGRGSEKKILIQAVNMGPGEVHLTSIPLKPPRWADKDGLYMWGSVMPEPGTLPVALAVGKQAMILLPYRDDCFLSRRHAGVGLGDSFGRHHWAPRKQLRRAEATYEKDFPLGPSESTRSSKEESFR